MKKPRFTIEQHLEVARELYPVRERLIKLFLRLSRAYPHQSKPVRALGKAEDYLQSFLWAMESEMFKENPALGPNGDKVYCGPDDSVRTGREPLEWK